MFSAPRVVVVVIVSFELFAPVTTSAQVNFEKNGYYLSLGDSVRAVYPTATSTQVTNTSLRSRRAFSVGSADSKKSSRASMEVGSRGLDHLALARNVALWTEGHVHVVLAFDDGGQLPRGLHGSMIAPLDGNGERERRPPPSAQPGNAAADHSCKNRWLQAPRRPRVRSQQRP